VTTRRGMLAALGLTALGAALVLATAGQPRWSAPGQLSLVGGGAPAATALALVALAGVGLLFLLTGRARTVIGVLLVLTGAAVVVVDFYSGRGWFAYSSLVKSPLDVHRSVWFWLTAAGGVLLGNTASRDGQSTAKGYSEVYVCPEAFSGNFVLKQMGRGFVKVGGAETDPEDIRLVEAAWTEAHEAIYSGEWDMVILDEINYAIGYKMLDPAVVADALRGKPEMVHVILTGRNAHPLLVELADTVTEMREVKHAYQKGILAQRGIEF